MKKIYLVIAGAFLIFLIIISIFLSLSKKSSTETQKDIPFPTSVPQAESNRQNNQLPIETENVSQTVNANDISTITPVETKDFKLQYSPKLKKIVVEKKTSQAEEQFIKWADQNKQDQLIKNPNLVLIVNQGKNPDDFNPIIEFLNIFLNLGKGIKSSNINSPTSLADIDNSTQNTNNQSKVYYAQCGDQGSLPLPDGCNLCQAGCGPTTAAMIASSYLGSGYDPKAIVNLYGSKNYLLGCGGSRTTDAYSLLNSLGLETTTNIFSFNSEKSDTVVSRLRKYLNDGWTFFTLAYFCEAGCGHFFWITDIDNQGNILAYDPAYGRYQIPYNENSRYPYPLYKAAFGVKK
jgi:hypothetical protein